MVPMVHVHDGYAGSCDLVPKWQPAMKGYALASMQPGEGQAKVCRWFSGTGVAVARRGQGGQAVLVRCACVGTGGVRCRRDGGGSKATASAGARDGVA